MSSSCQNDNNNSINILNNRAAERHVHVHVAAEQYRTDYEHAQSCPALGTVLFSFSGYHDFNYMTEYRTQYLSLPHIRPGPGTMVYRGFLDS